MKLTLRLALTGCSAALLATAPGGFASAGARVFRVAPARHESFAPVWCSWKGGEGLAKYRSVTKGLESFESMIGMLDFDEKIGADGRICYGWEDADARLGLNTRQKVFFRVLARASFNPHRFYNEEFTHDRSAFEKWKAAHPNWMGFESSEWGNDAYQHIRRPEFMLNCGKKSITSNDLARLLKERPKPKTREEFVEKLLRPVFDRVVEWAMGDPADLLLGEGHYCIEHLAGCWGAGKLAIETSRDYRLWQAQMMFCRGAARQFSRPWEWYIASFASGCNATFFAEPHATERYFGPQYGISPSAIRRVTYLTYLSGANWYEREAMNQTHFLFKTDPPRLSDEGRMYDAFYSFTKRYRRGTVYVPIALLVPAFRGYTRHGGRAFELFDYTRPDYMLDAIMSVILDFPNSRCAKDRQRSVEVVMANSRYGDMFDVLTPDFPNQDSFRGTIGDYGAAVLVGEYGENAEMEGILRSYVKAGGTLVLNAKQVTSGFPTSFTGVAVRDGWKDGDRSFSALVPGAAAVLRRDAVGRATFTVNRFGKGLVIVCAEDWLVPWYGDDGEGQARALGDTQIGSPIRYPDIEWLLAWLEDGLLPVRVSGDIQYGINRTPAGWGVYLINNKGVRKAWDRPQEVQDGAETVEIDASAIPHSSAVEHVVGDPVRIDGGVLRIAVPYGDVRVVEIR